MPSVLFVCTANICRSPMAMELFRAKLGQEAMGWEIESAGTWALIGEPAVSKVHEVLAERGLDISSHQSRIVDLDIISQFNLILTMEQGHKEALQVEFPEHAARIFMFSEMIGLKYDIKDPIGGPMYEFQETAKEIDRIIEEGSEKIKKLA
ncbi:MAG: hypothetical protein ACFFEW_17245, partial [Candidatus Thorarchaeota archaeon]